EGVARTQPIAGVPLQMQSSGWDLVAAPGATGSDGVAVFTFRCDEAGSVTAAVVLFDGTQDRSFPLEVPSCGPRPTTTTSSTTTTEPDDEPTGPTTTEDD
ncbi:MAG TPA: hypothetical protein VGE43_04120, partial [Acidimicrobiales bacterium]